MNDRRNTGEEENNSLDYTLLREGEIYLTIFSEISVYGKRKIQILSLWNNTKYMKIIITVKGE